MADDPLITFRICAKCGVEKPATKAFFQAYGPEGQFLRRACKLCRGAKTEGGYRPCERLTDDERRERNRSRCRDYFARNRSARLEKIRNDRKSNPEKHREWNRRNCERNRGAGSDYEKRRYARRDKEKAREEVKRWKAENPDKVRKHWERTYAKHKPKHTARALRWVKNNPEAVKASRNRRRARICSADGSHTKDDIRDLLKKYGRVCFYCATSLTKFHVDHFIPLCRGGDNAPGNLRLSCPDCNWSKGSKMPWEWMPDMFQREGVTAR